MSSWASFGVALVALVQVWVINLWRRFFRRGTVDIFDTGLVEVGYSTLGPTLALQGTLRAVDREQFVREIQVVVTRERDGAKHTFAWEVFRGGQRDSADTATALPAGFLISTAQPYRYNIFFSDVETREELGAILAPVADSWNAALASEPPESNEARIALYDAFQQNPVHVTAHTRLSHALYWTAGRYRLEMLTMTSRPDRTHLRAWHFTLTPENFEALRLNAIAILMFACGFTNAHFNFANVNFEDGE